MKNIMKRAASLVLAGAMCFSILPFDAFAAGPDISGSVDLGGLIGDWFNNQGSEDSSSGTGTANGISGPTEVAVGETITLTTGTVGSQGSWSSSSTKTATVKKSNSDGSQAVVTGVKEGTVTITYSYSTGSGWNKSTVNLTYIVKVVAKTQQSNPAVTLSETSVSLTGKGETHTLTASLTDLEGSVTWNSSDESVATVANGVVTAVGAGTATITASVTSSGKTYSDTASVTVTIKQKNPAVTLSEKSVSLTGKGETHTLTASLTDLDSENIVVWTSSDESVATVNNGVVTAVGAGTATITATVNAEEDDLYGNSYSASANVTVTFAEYDLYYYALIPGCAADGSGSADSRWFGIGVGKICGVENPANLSTGTIITDYTTGAVSKALYPDLTYNGKTYQYAAEGSGHESDYGYYTLKPYRVTVSSGANSGNNGYNTYCNAGTNTYHYDFTCVLNETETFSVEYSVLYPGESAYQTLTGSAQRVKSGTAESSLSKPGTGDVPAAKTVNGIRYTFDGWYTDSACTNKASFSGTVTANTMYYGRYVASAAAYTVEYYYDGVLDSSATYTGTAQTIGTVISSYPEKTKTGFTFSEDTAPLTITADSAANVIRVYYIKRTVSVKVYYLLNGTSEAIANAESLSGKVGTTVTGNAKTVDGYTLVNTAETTKSVDITTGTESISFYYRKNITLTASSAEYTYDGTEKTVSGLTVSGALAAHEPGLAAVTPSASGTDAGTYKVTLSDSLKGTADSTGIYLITGVTSGALTIKPRTVTLTAASGSKQYDGTPLTDSTVTVSGDGFARGEGVNASAAGSQTLVGSSANTVSYQLNAGTKTANYTITVKNGTLTVTDRTAKYEVTVEANSGTAGYNGSAHTVSGLKQTEFTVNGQKYTVSGLTASRTETNAGNYDVAVAGTAKVTDANGSDVTAQFTVHTVKGSLTIEKAAVTVTANDKSKTYGDADPELTATVTGPVGGDTITYTLTRAAGENAGEYVITPAGAADQGNYTVTYNTGKLTITQKPVTVTAADNGKTYGDADPALTASVTGLLGDDTVTYTVTRAAGETVGEYAITAAGEASQGNYKVTYANGTFEIKKASMTVNGIADGSKAYDGEPLKGAEAIPSVTEGTKVEYSVDGGKTWTETVPEIGPGVTNETTVQVRVTNPNYEDVTGSYTLKITAKKVTVTANANSKTYGDTDPELTAAVEGLVGSDSVIYTVSRASGENIGSYTITPAGSASQGNYAVTYKTAQFTISPKAIKVTADNKSKTYGAADPELTAAVTGLVGSDSVSYTVSRAAGETVGEYAITPAGDAKQGNYTVTYETGKLTITKAGALTVTGTDLTKVYDGSVLTSTAAVPSVTEGTTVQYSADGGKTWSETAPEIGPDITAKTTVQVKAVNANYDDASCTYTLEITPKPVTVTAADNSKTYGAADPELTAAVTGLIGDDTISYTVTRAAGETVGEYAITAAGDAAQGNYTVTYANGTFEIKKASMTVTGIADASKPYDGEPLKGAEAAPSVTDGTKVEYSTDGGKTWSETVPEIGPDVTDETKVDVRITNPNYEDVTGSYTLSITPKPVTVTANAKSKTYGDADPALDAAVEGLVGSDTVSYTVSRASGENTGSYTITPAGNAKQGNYTVTYSTAKLTISPKAVTVTANDKTKTYGDTNPVLDAAVSGLLSGDTVEYTVSRVKGENVGEYVITPAGDASQGNYTVAYNTGKLTITQKPVTVAAADNGKTYGDADPALTASVTGLLGNDTVTYTVTRAAGENVGKYTITAAGEASQGNYKVTCANGTFEIKKASMTVNGIADGSKAYDGEPLKGAEAIPAVTEGTKVEYSVDGGKTWSETVPSVGPDVTAETTVQVRVTNPNYEDVTGSYTLKITAKKVTVTAAANSKTYGDTDPELTAAVEGLVGSDTVSYTVSRASGENTGSYTITPAGAASQGNYAVTYKTAQFTISPKAIKVTADNKSKTYGAADPELTAAVTGLVGTDTVTYTVTRAAGETVGEYVITPAGDAKQGNYTVTYETGKLTITKAGALTVTGTDLTKVYDGSVLTSTAAVPSVTEGTTVQYSADGGKTWSETAPEIGPDITAKTTVQVKAVNANYDDASCTYTLEITPKPVTVTAADNSKTYGAADPELTAAVTGLIGDDTVSYTVTRAAGETVGEYVVTAAGDAAQGNYTVTYANGTFTIDKATMTVTGIDDASKTYDGEPLKGAEAAPSVTEGTKVEYSTDGGKTWTETVPEIGPDVTDETRVDVRITNPNYEDVTGSYTLKIDPKPVTVTAADNSKIYGYDDPVLTAQVDGVLGEEVSAADASAEQAIAYTVTRAAGEDVGEYAITVTGEAVQGNYAVTYVNGTFTIKLRYQTLTIHYVTKSGKQLAPDYVGSYALGEQFSVESPKVSGYKPDYRSVSSDENGMPMQDVEVSVIYTAVSTGTETDTAGTPVSTTPPTGGSDTTPADRTPAESAAPAENIEEAESPDGVVRINEDGEAEITEIDESETPLDTAAAEETGTAHSWALFNLLMTILSVLLCIVMLLGVFGRNKKQDENSAEENAAADTEDSEEPEEKKRHRLMRLLSILPAAVSVILFVLYEDMSAAMAFIDKWTLPTAILLIVTLVLLVLSRKTKKDNDDDDENTANA